MKKYNRYLTGLLLLLIGVVIGALYILYQQKSEPVIIDQAEVKTTNIRYSDEPAFTSEELQKIDERFLFKEVAQLTRPSVVYIQTKVITNYENIPDDDIHKDQKDDKGFWDGLFPHKAHTAGSGIIISSDGYILTNNHVVDQAVEGSINITLHDKRHFDARLVGADPTTDLAVLKIDGQELPAIAVGNSNKVEVGDWVMAIGNPFQLRSTVTAGIVSALNRDMHIIHNQRRIESFIQTDAAINKGNSGGALVNTSGELIGVNTAIASMSGNYQGYGFAAPSNLAFKVATDIIEYGEVRRGLLGVTIRTNDAYTANELEMDSIHGVQIVNLVPDGMAEKSGLEQDDIILSVDGHQVNKSNELQLRIAVRDPGDVVDLLVWRSGEKIHKEVTLGKLPETDEK